jgi:hypothetical protein
VAITVEQVATTHRHPGEPRLRVVTNRDDRYLRDRVQTLDHVIVMYAISLVEDHDERVLNGVSEELMDTVDGGVPRELLADVSRMLTERLAKDRTGTLAEDSDVSVRDGGAFFESIKRVARKHRFANTTRTADQGVVWARSAKCRLKRTRELTYL